MTGLECLREEMIKRGATKAQTESKAVAMVLDIVANTGTVYIDIDAAQRKLNSIKAEMSRAESKKLALDGEIAALEARCSGGYRNLQHEMDKFEEQKAEFKQYIERFNAALESMETEEARDRLRAAQVFVNSITVKTAYDNTAFINGLWTLLAGVKTGDIVAFKNCTPEVVTRHEQLRANPPKKRY